MRKTHHDVQYSHLETGEGQITCAGLMDEENGLYHFGIALCSPSDNFSRRKGRELALRKLFNPAGHTCTAGTIAMPKKKRHSVMARHAAEVAMQNLRQLGKNRWYQKVQPEHLILRDEYLQETKKVRKTDARNQKKMKGAKNG